MPPSVADGSVHGSVHGSVQSYQPLRTLGDTPRETPSYLVDNSQLRALASRGLGYRNSPSMEDMARGVIAKWGDIVEGRDYGGWLRVGNRFLPMFVNGHQVLLPLVNDDGAFMQLGTHPATLKTFYCGRRFKSSGGGKECGPHFGPQCPSCDRFQQWRDSRRVTSLYNTLVDFVDVFVTNAFVAFLDSLTDLGAAFVYGSKAFVTLTVFGSVLLVLPQILCWNFMRVHNLATYEDLPNYLMRLKIWEEAIQAWSKSASNPYASAILTLIQVVLQSFPQQLLAIVGCLTLALDETTEPVDVPYGALPWQAFLFTSIAVSWFRMARSLLRWDLLGQPREPAYVRGWRITLRGAEVSSWTLSLALTIALARPAQVEAALGQEAAALTALSILWLVLAANFGIHYSLIFHLTGNRRKSAMWAGVCAVASPPLFLVHLRPIRKTCMAMRLVQSVALPLLAAVAHMVASEEEGASSFRPMVEHIAINHASLVYAWAAAVGGYAALLLVGSSMGFLNRGTEIDCTGDAAFTALAEGDEQALNILSVVADLPSLRDPEGNTLADVSAANPTLPAWQCLDDLVRRGIFLQQRRRTIMIELFRMRWLEEAHLDLLVSAGAELNGKFATGETVVDMMVREKGKEYDWTLLAALVRRGARLDYFKGTIIRDLMQIGSLTSAHMRLLEQAGADPLGINSVKPGGRRVHDQLVRFLDTFHKLKKQEGESAVDVASRDPSSKEWALVPDLVKRGICLDKRAKTAMVEILLSGKMETSHIKVLVKAGADINGPVKGMTAADHCVVDPRKPLWQLLPELIKHGGRVQFHHSILPFLIQKDWVEDQEKIDLLLEAGVDVNGVSKDDVNALDLVMLRNDVAGWDLVEHLVVECDAKPHKRLHSCIPIVLTMGTHCALKLWSKELKERDQQKKIAPADTENKIHRRHKTMLQKNAACVKALLERGADPNGTSDWGQSRGASAADIAVKTQQWQALRVLLSYDAKLTKSGKLQAKSKKLTGAFEDSGIKPDEWQKLGV